MAQIELKNPSNLQGWQFTTPAELLSALEIVVDEGFMGSLLCYETTVVDPQEPETINEVKVWRLTIAVPGQEERHVYLSPAISPEMTTWLVYNGQTPETFTDADFHAKYQIVG